MVTKAKKHGPSLQSSNKPWQKIFAIAVLLLLVTLTFSGCVSLLLPSETVQQGNVAIISLHGTIGIGSSGAFSSTNIINPASIQKLLDVAESNPKIKAIILDINSPGGAPVASAELALMVKNVEKPIYAVIREVGASGAYWVASASDRIYANEFSMTGSIGVIASYLEFSGLLDDFNITYNRQVAGDLKDMGSPYKEMDEQERIITKARLDKMHELFMQDVANNRNMSVSDLLPYATGEVFLGIEAIEIGLIDKLGGFSVVYGDLESELDEPVVPMNLQTKTSFFDVLSGVSTNFARNVGMGLGQSVHAIPLSSDSSYASMKT